jgi:hypothetical protein
VPSKNLKWDICDNCLCPLIDQLQSDIWERWQIPLNQKCGTRFSEGDPPTLHDVYLIHSQALVDFSITLLKVDHSVALGRELDRVIYKPLRAFQRTRNRAFQFLKEFYGYDESTPDDFEKHKIDGFGMVERYMMYQFPIHLAILEQDQLSDDERLCDGNADADKRAEWTNAIEAEYAQIGYDFADSIGRLRNFRVALSEWPGRSRINRSDIPEAMPRAVGGFAGPYTIPELARKFHRSERTINRWLNNNTLPHEKLSPRAYMIPEHFHANGRSVTDAT